MVLISLFFLFFGYSDRNNVRCFNDDIQGTGCVALAGILSALRSVGFDDPLKALSQQRIVMCGAGSAGLGVAETIVHAMTKAGSVTLCLI